MIRYLYEEKPQTIRIGATLRGMNYVFVNFDVQEFTEETEETEELADSLYNYSCVGKRFALSDLSVKSLMANMPQEFVVLANEDEIQAIMKAFNATEDVEAWKYVRLAQIEAYDTSSYVNNFKINGIDAWLDKNTRVGLVNMLQSNWGDSDVPELWLDEEHPISLPSADAGLQLLNEIEKYAAQCYSVTQRLIVSVKNLAKLNSLEELQNFDYKSTYPAQLDLTI